jgi:hypothetical protein
MHLHRIPDHNVGAGAGCLILLKSRFGLGIPWLQECKDPGNAKIVAGDAAA